MLPLRIGEYVYRFVTHFLDTVIGFISVSGYFLPEHHALDRLTAYLSDVWTFPEYGTSAV